MITEEIDYLDGEITIQEEVPNTLAELVPILGTEENVISEATDNLRYRNKFPRVYKLASKELETVVARAESGESKTLKDGTVRKSYQSVMEHVRAAYKADPTTTRTVITKLAQEQPLYVKGERTGNTGKISAANQEVANTVIAAGADAVTKTVTKIESTVPGYKVGLDGDGAPTPESLARGIQAFAKYKEQQRKKDDLAELVG